MELAFPMSVAVTAAGDVYHSGELHPDFVGMTLRDYLAAKALVALGPTVEASSGTDIQHVMESLATISYRMADAMLKAREA